MCDSLDNEIGRLAGSLNLHHGGPVTAVAVLIYLTSCLFTHYGAAHAADLAPMQAVQRACVAAYVREQGVGMSEVDAALADLRRANSTVAYLASLPG